MKSVPSSSRCRPAWGLKFGHRYRSLYVCVLTSDIGLSKLLVHKFLRTISGKAANADISYLPPFLPISHSMKPPLHTMLISDWAVQKTTALQFVTLVHTFSFPKIKYFLPQKTSFCFHSHKIFFPYNTQFLCTLGWKEKSAMHHHTAGSSELSDPKTKLASQPCSTKESIRKVITPWRKCIPAGLVL